MALCDTLHPDMTFFSEFNTKNVFAVIEAVADLTDTAVKILECLKY